MIKSLSQCLELVIDKRGVTPKKLNSDWTASGYRVLSANNVKTTGIEKVDDIRFVDEETYKKWMKEEIKRGDVLLTSEAPAGEVFYWDSDEKIVAGQRIYVLRTNSDVNPLFLKYYIQSDKGQAEIRNKCSGSTVFGISAKTFDDIEIVLPDDKETQDKIADTLRTLDKKIENNNAIIAEMEAMAKTIYDYWFLQFEFSDENGKPYKSSGGKMVWNEELKRDIPDGWGVIHLGEITNCLDSKRVPLSAKDRETKKGSIPYYGATGIMDYVNEAIFDGDYVLMAEDGSVMDDNGNPILQRISGKVWVNNHAHVLEPSKGHCCKLLMLLLKDVQVLTIKTGSVQMKINQEKMNGIAMPDIPDELLKKANDIFDEIDKQQLHRRNENQELASLRDFLLPLLMNGQVTFKGE